MAAYWGITGATFLHLVDLDGALAGYSVNEDAIRRIVAAFSKPIEIGGGIRTEGGHRAYAEFGRQPRNHRDKAVENPFPPGRGTHFGADRIVAGVDAKNGLVAIEGWEKLSEITASDLCGQMKEYGVRHVVYTDISRDGMLTGPNVEATKALTEATGMDIIASGGMSSMDDLRRLHEAGVKGAIIGKALYENRINLKEAVGAFEGQWCGRRITL